MKAEMTSLERIMAVINKQPFDIYPAINPTSVACIGGMEHSHALFPKAHIYSQDMVRLAATGHDLLGFDSVAPYFSTLLESSALGSEIDWGDKYTSPHVTSYSIKKMDQLHIPVSYINRKEFQQLIMACQALNERYHGEVAVIGKVVGPWTLAYQLYGVEKLLIDAVLSPKETKNFISALSRIPIEFAKKQFEAGAHIVTWAEHCTSDLVSPGLYEEFVAPIHRAAVAELSEYGPIILHMCGSLIDRLHIIADTGVKILHIDSRNDIEQAYSQIKHTVTLTGSINNPFTLLQGRPSTVKKEVYHNIKCGIQLISPECGIPSNVPVNNMLALTEAAHGYRCQKGAAAK